MTKQCFGTSHVPLSPAVRAGEYVFVSGQVPVDSDGVVVKGGITEQTARVANAQQLESGGIYLSDQDMAAINNHLAQIYNALMEGDVDGEVEDDEDNGR